MTKILVLINMFFLTVLISACAGDEDKNSSESLVRDVVIDGGGIVTEDSLETDQVQVSEEVDPPVGEPTVENLCFQDADNSIELIVSGLIEGESFNFLTSISSPQEITNNGKYELCMLDVDLTADIKISIEKQTFKGSCRLLTTLPLLFPGIHSVKIQCGSKLLIRNESVSRFEVSPSIDKVLYETKEHELYVGSIMADKEPVKIWLSDGYLVDYKIDWDNEYIVSIVRNDTGNNLYISSFNGRRGVRITSHSIPFSDVRSGFELISIEKRIIFRAKPITENKEYRYQLYGALITEVNDVINASVYKLSLDEKNEANVSSFHLLKDAKLILYISSDSVNGSASDFYKTNIYGSGVHKLDSRYFTSKYHLDELNSRIIYKCAFKDRNSYTYGSTLCSVNYSALTEPVVLVYHSVGNYRFGPMTTRVNDFVVSADGSKVAFSKYVKNHGDNGGYAGNGYQYTDLRIARTHRSNSESLLVSSDNSFSRYNFSGESQNIFYIERDADGAESLYKNRSPVHNSEGLAGQIRGYIHSSEADGVVYKTGLNLEAGEIGEALFYGLNDSYRISPEGTTNARVHNYKFTASSKEVFFVMEDLNTNTQEMFIHSFIDKRTEKLLPEVSYDRIIDFKIIKEGLFVKIKNQLNETALYLISTMMGSTFLITPRYTDRDIRNFYFNKEVGVYYSDETGIHVFEF